MEKKNDRNKNTSQNKLYSDEIKEMELIDVVNLKCDSVLVGSLLCESGFFPAYHMSKGSWITVALDGTIPDDKIKMLLDMSYHLTDKIKKPRIQR